MSVEEKTLTDADLAEAIEMWAESKGLSMVSMHASSVERDMPNYPGAKYDAAEIVISYKAAEREAEPDYGRWVSMHAGQ